MQWQQICDNPLFRDMPFKFETNCRGQIVMSPATNQHGLYQARIVRWLSTLLTGGEPLVECGIQTAEGVKVADVAWGSTAFFQKELPSQSLSGSAGNRGGDSFTFKHDRRNE
jgi:hypothetical protein